MAGRVLELDEQTAANNTRMTAERTLFGCQWQWVDKQSDLVDQVLLQQLPAEDAAATNLVF